MLFWCSDADSTSFSMIHLKLNMLHSNMYNSMVKYVKQYSKKENKQKQNSVYALRSNFAFVLIWEQGKKISTQCE